MSVIFNSKVFFIDQFKMLKNKISQRINVLKLVANYCFRSVQLSLTNMHVAYMWSILEYRALVWYLFLSISNIYALKILENQALYKITGVTISTRILDLHLEISILPIKLR